MKENIIFIRQLLLNPSRAGALSSSFTRPDVYSLAVLGSKCLIMSEGK